MAKTTPPVKTKKPHQKSVDINPFLWRMLPKWNQPEWYEADAWRKIVRAQPVAMLCRETLIANVLDLDWKIEPRDSNQRDELRNEMDYYTGLLQHNGEIDWTTFIELLMQDFLDIPFGAGFELGYEEDDPDNRLIWYEHLDGSTLFPTLVPEYPVGQYVKEAFQEVNQPVFFPRYAINRMYMSPRTEIKRKGWGMAPPEKVYLALQMLSRGDTFYANLLIDTPEAGLLDLGDMSQESAEEWVEAFRSLVTGIDAFKIPVLYEHNQAAKWIPFGRSPSELSYNNVTTKYAALVTAGYGLSLSDIGMQVTTSGGETLAGSIRQERRTRKTGLARAKKSIKYFIDRMIDPRLKFDWIDLDDELSVALGRARLANSTALTQLMDSGMITDDEGRLQLIADGMMSIPMKETLDESEKPQLDNDEGSGESPERPGLLGRQRPPSQGGRGEVKQSIIDNVESYVSLETWKPVIKKSIPYVREYLNTVFDAITGDDLDEWDNEFANLLFEQSLPEHLNVDISHLNHLEKPLELNTISNLNETIEKSIIFAIKDNVVTRIKEEELDINDIIVDNKVEQSILDDMMMYLSEIRKVTIKSYKENNDERVRRYRSRN